MNVYIRMLVMSLMLTGTFYHTFAQPNTEIEFKDKPKRYEHRLLRAEKTPNKKFGFITRIFQNNFSHYNYYFNANNKMNELLARAKAAHKDDYDNLLSYYNYSLDVTSGETQELDSIMYKSTAGIALHDLRSEWVDNFLLLIGQVYFFRKDMDSAYQTFQYINYAFAPKEEGGYDIPIGSNASNTGGVFTIVTNEKQRPFTKKALGVPPSRNDALLWLVRVFIETKKYGEATGLLQILNNDPVFPKRLQPQLAEINGYLYYNQKNYDSAAHFIIESLKAAENNNEKARKEYLAAQLYVLAGQPDKAVEYFENSAKHTIDPVMEVNAVLNAIKNGNANAGQINKTIEDLVKMARKDKYELYRDVIYYTAAKAELEKKNYDNAEKLLIKSVTSSIKNPEQKNNSFLLLADISFNRKNYLAAGSWYDSVNIALLKPAEKSLVETHRKPFLKTISENTAIVFKQDSLQYIASLSPDERQKIEKQERKRNRRKKRNASDQEEITFGSAAPVLNNNAIPDLFNDGKEGDWYFNSQNLKSKGFTEYQQKWGNRPNVDNWRRKDAIDRSMSMSMNVNDVDDPDEPTARTEEKREKIDILPITPDELAASNDMIIQALLENAAIYADAFKDYTTAEKTYLEALKRSDEFKNRDEALFKGIYAAQKNAHKNIADSLTAVLLNDYPKSKWVTAITNPAGLQKQTQEGEKAYEKIYDLFLEGNFAAAREAKLKADSIYGDEFWTQQLLFIESIYYIKERDDSTAILTLAALIKKDSKSPLAEKAATMLDVLRRRSEIEAYLTSLQVERNETEVSKPVDLHEAKTVAVPENKNTKPENIIKAPAPEVKTDSLKVVPSTPVSGFSFNPDDKHFVAAVLKKVDPVFVNESRNSFNRYNKTNFYNQQIPVTIDVIDDVNRLVLLGPFNNAGEAVNYLNSIKPYVNKRILPWLARHKYSFIIVSESNLQKIRENKNIDEYSQMLKETLPDL